MNASELLDALNRAGATIEIVDGKPRLRGAKVPDELLVSLKENRDAVIAEFEHRKNADRDRFGRVPGHDAAIIARDLNLPADMQAVMCGYVMRQGRVVQTWLESRACEYFGLGVSADDCDWRAAVDLVAWQRHATAKAAIEFVSGINEAIEHFTEKFPADPE